MDYENVFKGAAVLLALSAPPVELPVRIQKWLKPEYMQFARLFVIAWVLFRDVTTALLSVIAVYITLRVLADPVATTEHHIPEERGLAVSEDLARKMRGDGGVVHSL